MNTVKQNLTGDNYSRNFYSAQQTFESVVLIAALSYIYTDSNLKREEKYFVIMLSKLNESENK